MKLPVRSAAVFALLLVLAISPEPGLAQISTRHIIYADTLADGAQAACANGGIPVVDGTCTATIELSPSLDVVVASLHDSSRTRHSVSIPVELIIDGSITGNERLSGGHALQGTRAGFPTDERHFSLEGVISVFHSLGATEDASLTLTILERSRIVGGQSGSGASDPRGVDVRVESDADVTVDNRGIILSRVSPIRLVSIQQSASDVTIRNRGILSGQTTANPNEFEPLSVGAQGIVVRHYGTGDLTIANEVGMVILEDNTELAGGVIRSGEMGIDIEHFSSDSSAGDIRITTEGRVEGTRFGIRLDMVGTSNTVSRVWMRVQEGAHVVGRNAGIRTALVDSSGGDDRTDDIARTCDAPITGNPLYRHCIAVLGTVEYSGTESLTRTINRAAVHISGSGLLILGPNGRVAAPNGQPDGRLPAAPAVLFRSIDGADPGAAAIRYLVRRGQTGVIDGEVLRVTAVSFRSIFKNGDTPQDPTPPLSDVHPIAFEAWVLPEDLTPEDVLDAIDEHHQGEMSQEDFDALLARIQQIDLRATPMFMADDGGCEVTLTYNRDDYTFAREQVDPDCEPVYPDEPDEPDDPTPRDGVYNVYEALPSVLLSVNRPLSHDDRWSAPRVDGWWAWAEAAGGNWEANASTMGDASVANGEYDYDRYSAEIGRDWMVSENAVVGLSAHYRDINADIGDSGSIDAEGYGVGVSARVHGEKTYLALQGSATWYEVDGDAKVGTGDAQTTLRRNNVDAFGWTAGAELGHRLEFGEVTVTPRAGLTYSEVDLDSFEGHQGRVSLEDGESMIGHAGVRVQRGGLYAAVDVEHEFSDDERRVDAANADGPTVLESEAEDTRVRATAGGIHEWGEGRYSLQVQLNYEESDGDNDEFGGSLTLQGRF